MLSKIKLYFTMKKLNKQMKYELLSQLYLIIANKERYIQFIQQLVTDIDFNNFQEELIEKVAEFTHSESTNEK